MWLTLPTFQVSNHSLYYNFSLILGIRVGVPKHWAGDQYQGDESLVTGPKKKKKKFDLHVLYLC